MTSAKLKCTFYFLKKDSIICLMFLRCLSSIYYPSKCKRVWIVNKLRCGKSRERVAHDGGTARALPGGISFLSGSPPSLPPRFLKWRHEPRALWVAGAPVVTEGKLAPNLLLIFCLLPRGEEFSVKFLCPKFNGVCWKYRAGGAATKIAKYFLQ